MSALLKPERATVDLATPAAAAAALRTFWKLAEAWALSPAEQATLLGVGRTTLYQWKQGKVGVLDRHQLERLSYLFGIYGALQILFPARAPCRRVAAQAECGAAVRRTLRPRAHARRPGRRSLRGARVPRRPARGQGLIDPAKIPLDHTVWRPSYRLIPSRYPTVALYDAIADPADLEVVFAIEALTNPRIREELGELERVPREERVAGAGSTPIMAAFTHLNPEGSRFSDGSYGVYYAAHALETAIAEVGHHRAVFLARTAEPALDIDLRLISANLDAELHDLRHLGAAGAELFDPDHYASAAGARPTACAPPAAGVCSSRACATPAACASASSGRAR